MADLATIEKSAIKLAQDTSDWINRNIKDNKITVPEGYNVSNEITMALMMIAQTEDKDHRPALEKCTRESIMTQLRLMAQNGVSMARKQCYPIVRGTKLCIDISYFGTISIIKRLMPGYDVRANVIYKDDIYDYIWNEETQCYQVTNIRSSIENRDKPIVGAYGTIFEKATGKVIFSEVMSWKEILTAWSHAKTDKVQKEFPQEMAKRTLIQRMCKLFLNTEKMADSEGAKAYNEMTSNSYDNDTREPSINDMEKRQAIMQKSQGDEGLKSILRKNDATDVEAKSVESRETNEEGVNSKAESKDVNLPTQAEPNVSEAVFGIEQEEEIPF